MANLFRKREFLYSEEVFYPIVVLSEIHDYNDKDFEGQEIQESNAIGGQFMISDHATSIRFDCYSDGYVEDDDENIAALTKLRDSITEFLDKFKNAKGETS